jgi:hypothetical protein
LPGEEVSKAPTHLAPEGLMRARSLVLLLLVAGVAVTTRPAAAADTSDVDGDGWSVVQGDCNDNNSAVNPGAVEICDGLDNDCDLMVDEMVSQVGEPCTLGCGSVGVFACGAEGGVICVTEEPPGDLCGAPLDVDGDGAVKALTDTLLLVRWSFGFTGNTLIAGVLDPECTRCTADEIIDHIEEVLLAVP